MITDDFLKMSSAQTVTGTGTVVSTNTIDLGTARDVFAGEDQYVHFSVDTTFTGLTSLTLQVISSAAANLSSPTVLASTAAIPVASLVAGARFALEPRNVGSVGQRYLGVQYVIAGTGTAGAISATIVHDIEDRKNYASGFAII